MAGESVIAPTSHTWCQTSTRCNLCVMAELSADAPVGLRESKKARTRQAISDVATQLFAAHGFERVTIAQIAAAADVSVKTVFNYFPTKEDLFFDRAGELVEGLIGAIQSRPPGTTVVQALHALAGENLVPFAGTGWRGVRGAERYETLPALLATQHPPPPPHPPRRAIPAGRIPPPPPGVPARPPLPQGEPRPPPRPSPGHRGGRAPAPDRGARRRPRLARGGPPRRGVRVHDRRRARPAPPRAVGRRAGARERPHGRAPRPRRRRRGLRAPRGRLRRRRPARLSAAAARRRFVAPRRSRPARSAVRPAMATALLWYRRDLRLHDHPALTTALREYERVVPVFVLDDALLHGRFASTPRTHFMLGCLRALDEQLRARNSALVVRRGRPEQVLVQLAGDAGAEAALWTSDVAPYARARDRRVTDALRRAGGAARPPRGPHVGAAPQPPPP